jgi:alanyl-tRNA synthetase
VWTGARPYTKALSDLLEALREAGTSPDELTYLLSAAPGDATPTTRALLGLGIEPGRVLAGDRLPGVPLRMDPVLGPRLTLRRRSGAERFGHCDASCPCGCHVSVAHIQFVERRRTAEGLTPVPQPLFEVVASEHGLTPRTGTRPAVPLLLEPLVTSIETLLAGPTGPHPVFLADLASAAALLLGEGMVPGPRGGPYVVRKLLRTICTELATHGLPVTLLTPVITAAEVSYRVPLGLPQLPEKCWEYVAGECVAFERILRRGRRRVRGTGPSSERPHDTAQELIRLRSEWGVPLGVSLRWYREAGMDPSLVSLALADLRVGRTVPAPRSPESVAHP